MIHYRGTIHCGTEQDIPDASVLHESLEEFYSNWLEMVVAQNHCAEAPASFAYQCTSAVVYIAAYSELQMQWCKSSGGTTESRGLHG